MAFLKSCGKDNGVFTYKLKDEWEEAVVLLFSLSRKSNGMGVEIEYAVVKDFCVKYEWDSIDTFKLLKELNSRMD